MFPGSDNTSRFFGATLGSAVEVAIADGSSTRSAQLSPGRYLVHYRGLSDASAGVFWVRQGGSTVAAAAAAPSTAMGPGAAVRSMEINVLRGIPTVVKGATTPSVAASSSDYVAVWGASITGTLILTRIG